MKLSFYTSQLKFRYPFTIARGTRTVQEVVFVELEHEGFAGIGEASPSERYGETVETTLKFLQKLDLSKYESAYAMEEIQAYLQSFGQGNFAAKAAIDIALNDWMGKRLQIPLWKMWGLKSARPPRTSFTIGAGTIDEIVSKVRAAQEYPILKVKVGVPNDEEIISIVRSETDKPVYVDANEGWSPKEKALDKIKVMQSYGVELVEQPLPANDFIGMMWLKSRVRVPLIADESCVSIHDLPKLKDYFDGVNIKLMKCGGLKNAMQMIYTAKAILKMKVMLGCMIESSVGISAAAQLAPIVDYCDLDGNMLISNDPFSGVQNVDGQLLLSNVPGIGLTPSR